MPGTALCFFPGTVVGVSVCTMGPTGWECQNDVHMYINLCVNYCPICTSLEV